MPTQIKYPSIANPGWADVDKLLGDVPTDEAWVVTEKLNGTNLSFYVSYANWLAKNDEPLITAFSRNQRLGSTGESSNAFYSYHCIQTKHQPKLIAMAAMLQTDIIVYGELVGSAINRRVFYPEERDWYVFDILTDPQNYSGDRRSRVFFDFPQMLEVCAAVGLKTVPVIASSIRNLGEAQAFYQRDLSWLDEYCSAIAEMNAKGKPNYCEGVVLRPERTHFAKNGDRVMLKLTASKFRKRNSGKKKMSAGQGLSGEVEVWYALAQTYLTDNRLSGCVLNHGGADFSKFKAVLVDFIEDVLQAMSKEGKNIPLDFVPTIKRHLSKQGASMLRERILNRNELGNKL